VSECRNEGTGEIADSLGAAMKGCLSDLDEAEGCMEGVGGRIGRVGIDFADDALVAGVDGGLKQVLVQAVRQAALAHGRSDDDAVDIDEA